MYKAGEERFKKNIPPGYKDAGKSKNGEDTHFYYDGLHYERQYGDLILWKQLISKANIPEIEAVIFITDDSKEDWWYILSSNGKKIIGPLAELQAEIFRESNISNFHMYGTSMFLKDGKSNLSVEVEASSIEDASIQHAVSVPDIDIERIKEFVRSYAKSDIDNELMNKFVHSYAKSDIDNELMNKFVRSYAKSDIDNELMNKFVRSYAKSDIDNEFMNKFVRSYANSDIDRERMLEFFASQRLKNQLSSNEDSGED